MHLPNLYNINSYFILPYFHYLFIRFLLQFSYKNIFFYRTIKFQSSNKRKVVVEEEIIEEENEEPALKTIKTEEETSPNTTEIKQEPIDSTDPLTSEAEQTVDKQKQTKFFNIDRSSKLVSLSRNKIMNLVRVKKPATEVKDEPQERPEVEEKKTEVKIYENKKLEEVKEQMPNGLSLLGAYSGSENSDSE